MESNKINSNAKVLRARLMNQPEDFKRLGINPEKVETWEDGRRTRTEETGSEVWYFDGTMEDGTKYMVGYRPKSMDGMSKTVDSPHVNIYVKSPEGKEFRDDIVYPAGEGSFSREQCDTKVGPHWCCGDFKRYDLHFEPVHGVGLDLHYDALTDPFRQGTSLLAFGDNDEFYHTDLAVPKNRVSGRLFYDGEWHEVKGLGYHDHQWMNTLHFALYHHWLWGRMYTDLYTVYIYDFVAARQYGYKQLPMFGLMDNATGKVVFMTDGHFDLQTRLEPEVHQGREFPKESHYVFTNADGSRAEFYVTWDDQLEFWDMYEMAGKELRKRYDAIGMRMQYCRYYAKGGVRFTPAGGTTREANGDMIYEYAYMGMPDPAAHV